jgi:hypothetical protein
LPGWTEENHEKTQDMVAGFRAEIWTWNLQNTKQEC